MTFEKVIPALRKGAVISRKDGSIIKIRWAPKGHFERRVAAGWVTAKDISAKDIMSNDWVITEKAPVEDK